MEVIINGNVDDDKILAAAGSRLHPWSNLESEGGVDLTMSFFGA